MMTPLEYAIQCWSENLKTDRDYARIGEILGRPLTGNWCGWFAQACFRQYGLVAGVDLGSVYRCRATAQYKDPSLLKLWCAALLGDEWCACKVRDYHAEADQPRKLIKWRPELASPGDIVLHENSPGSANGHVMLYAGTPGGGVLYFIGGNQSGEFPDLSKGKGITRKVLRGTDPYPTWIVRLSDLDFGGDVKLCKTQKEAEALAAKLNGEPA